MKTGLHVRMVQYCKCMYFLQYGDKLYGPELTSADGSGSDSDEEKSSAADIASAVAEEVAKLKGSEEKPRRFQAVHSGAKHVVFIQCSDPVDPYELVHHMLMDVSVNGVRKSRLVFVLVTYPHLSSSQTLHFLQIQKLPVQKHILNEILLYIYIHVL